MKKKTTLYLKNIDQSAFQLLKEGMYLHEIAHLTNVPFRKIKEIAERFSSPYYKVSFEDINVIITFIKVQKKNAKQTNALANNYRSHKKGEEKALSEIKSRIASPYKNISSKIILTPTGGKIYK